MEKVLPTQGQPLGAVSLGLVGLTAPPPLGPLRSPSPGLTSLSSTPHVASVGVTSSPATPHVEDDPSPAPAAPAVGSNVGRPQL